jgi:hypothetical protein
MLARYAAPLFLTFSCFAQNATITGVVTDASTRMPLQGALVTAANASARTDIEGRYTLSIAAAEGIRIDARRNGYFAPAAPGELGDLAAGQSQSRNFTLRPLLKISGLIDETGCQAFALRRVSALGRFWYIPSGLATADTRVGKFEIRNLVPGEYVLEIVPENPGSEHCRGRSYYPDAGRIEMATPISVLSGDTALIIRFAHPDLRSITGSLTKPSSLQLIRYVFGEMRIVARLNVSKAGPFHIDGVPEGDYHLIALTPLGWASYAEVSVTDRDVTGLTIDPVPDVRMSGTVRMDDGSPVPTGLKINLSRVTSNPLITATVISNVSDGKFEVMKAAAAPDPRVAIIGLPKDYAVRPESTNFDWVLTRQRGTLAGDAKHEELILMPGAISLSGSFSTPLAPGAYKILRLSGDEKLLRADHEFLNAKAEQAESVEIHSGQTITLP